MALSTVLNFLFAVEILIFVQVSDGIRHGAPSRTLHFPSATETEGFKDGMFTVTASTTEERVLERVRRRVVDDTSPENMTSMFHFNDTHMQMIIHWAGEGSKVVVALTKNPGQPYNTSTSRVYFSYDYGKHFEMKTLRRDSPDDMLVDRFYNSPLYNSHYVFADVAHKYIATTENYGRTFRRHNIPFTPKHMSLHAKQANIILAHDEDDREKKLWYSNNFGSSWRVIQEDVKSYFWGVEPWDLPHRLYVERQESNGKSAIVASDNYFAGSNSGISLISKVEDFEIRDNYMFATRKRTVNGEDTLDLYVSHNRGPFNKAEFPDNNHAHKDYYVADASEDQVFLCVNHNVNGTHLYISEARGVRFSLSLENVVYFNPGIHTDTWLSDYMTESFADVHKVNGLRGVYIASHLRNGSLAEGDQVSMITFNKGGSWRSLEAPTADSNGKPTNCTRIPWWNPHFTSYSCSLHLTQTYHMIHPSHRTVPILSKESAVGLIMATGNVGTEINKTSQFNVYVSNDGGWEWREALKGTYFYKFGDHGGLIMAVRQNYMTGELLYSHDEGETWEVLEFSKEKMRIYGVLTEPGEKTTVFSIFGSRAPGHSWVVIQVNLSSIFRGRVCDKGDYKDWSPTDEPHFDCLLGRRTVYERRAPHSLCYNGEDYERAVVASNCTCDQYDYECDFGFKLEYPWSWGCERDPDSGVTDPSETPDICPEGSFYQRTKGYRKVSGDTCQGGKEHQFSPDNILCPDEDNEEFMFYNTRTSIHRYTFDTREDHVVPAGNLQNVVGLDYDMKQQCGYWADIRQDTIVKLCAGMSSYDPEVIINIRLQAVESVAVDWLSDTIFWVDGETPSIELAHKNGTHRRILFNKTDGLDKPRSLVLYPKQGYMFWSDWSSTHPGIFRAWMNGQNKRKIVSSFARVRWPNGLAIDDQFQRLYWTDANLHKISYCNFDGTGYKQLVSGYSNLPHPFSIAVYKEEIYWTDWNKGSIMTTNKHIGRPITTFKTNLPEIMDIKIFHHALQQEPDVVPCSSGTPCVSLCVERPNNDSTPLPIKRTCLCSEIYYSRRIGQGQTDEDCECAPGETMGPEGDCEIGNDTTTCAVGQFSCDNLRCVPMTWKCDNDDDCGDMSDERNCPYHTCRGDQFKCANARCIPQSWFCDHDDDCHDKSDEPHDCQFGNCTDSQFTCANRRCISKSWVCDGDDDCHDGSDEEGDACQGTEYFTEVPSNCSDSQFVCDNGICIYATWQCDGDNDCGDYSDERGCDATTSHSCRDWEFRCASGQCISGSWKCDGGQDCEDGSDEIDCPSTTTTTSTTTTRSPNKCTGWRNFRCANGNCVADRDRCDGVNDCGDNSDERNCYLTSPKPPQCPTGTFFCDRITCLPNHYKCDGVTNCLDSTDEVGCHSTTPSYVTCAWDEYRCDGDGKTRCIPQGWQCDGDADCPLKDDETGCINRTVTCSPFQFECVNSPGCLMPEWVCDGDNDCADSSDEIGCETTGETTGTPPPFSCPSWQFQCSDQSCVSLSVRCDGHYDCSFGEDEANCTQLNNVQVWGLRVVRAQSHSALISWEGLIGKVAGKSLTVKGMIKEGREYHGGEWRSVDPVSATAAPKQITFDELDPYTDYVYTVAVCISGKPNSCNQPVPPKHFRTQAGDPSAPVLIDAHVVPIPFEDIYDLPENHDPLYGINVTWKKPQQIDGRLDHYTVYCQDITDPAVSFKQQFQKSSMLWASSLSFMINTLTPLNTYKIWVTATTYKESEASNSKTVKFQVTDLTSCITGLTYDFEHARLSWGYEGNITAHQLRSFEVEIRCDNMCFYNLSVVKIDLSSSKTTWTYDVPPFTGYKGCVGRVRPHGVKGFIPDTVCREPSEVDVYPRGTEIPTPRYVKVEQEMLNSKISKLHVTWDQPSKTGKPLSNLVYRLHYDVRGLGSGCGRFNLTTTKPANGSYTFDNVHLRACQTYSVKVQVISPTYSPPSYETLFQTARATDAPPEKIRAEVTDVSATTANVNVIWDAPCPLEPRPPRKYSVDVTELNGPDISHGSFETKEFNGTLGLNYVIRDVSRGESLAIRVGSHSSAEISYWLSDPTNIVVAPYAPPENFRIQEINNFSSYRMSWDMPGSVRKSSKWSKIKYSFDIYHSEDYVHNSRPSMSNFTLFKTAVQGLSFFVGTLDPDRDHTFKVCIVINGFPGNFSDTQTIESLNAAKQRRMHGGGGSGDDGGGGKVKQSTLLAAVLPCVVLVLVLALALGAYVIRHRRLQRSFLSFANSHYDTRSGTTTFSSSDDLAEEEEPIIRGFSDDEPMVLA